MMSESEAREYLQSLRSQGLSVASIGRACVVSRQAAQKWLQGKPIGRQSIRIIDMLRKDGIALVN